MSQFLLAEAATEPLGGLAGWAVDLMDVLGGPGAALVVGADNLFPPIPSELVLPLAGFSASQGTFSLAAALIWTTLGSVAGAIIVYLLGAWLGRERTRKVIAKIPLMKVRDFDRSEAWFAKHGTKAVFLGRMIPLFRSVISLPAGVERMNIAKFLLLTTLGSLIWNTIFVMAGYGLGVNWHKVSDYADIFQKIVIVAVAIAVALFVVVRLKNRKHAGRDQDATQIIPPVDRRG
ncbi:membrane protein DedA with SNARE-associated domain [Kibdelosporangium banguiense]|uniref:Membrane protein DedA with SNARE-associated domain n=1 Tax=Kibdelosporangium banguiense TaxID=1365924 RepID=A0ABS4U0Q4_9PSEU|nr:DedA family protein [Kibdelosporangium banguiense]MBP2330240.1 membrane protein DedA with SNARE-associated domain [Kibdelosporangium banguiense]